MEHGVDQGAAIAEFLAREGFMAISTERDLVGRDRFTRATKR